MTLKYDWIIRAAGYFSIAGAAFFAIAWQWPLFDRVPEPGDGWIALGMIVACAGGGLCMLNESRRRVLLSSQGLEMFSPWGRVARLPWSEISSVAFSGLAKQFTIRDRSGQKVRVNAAMGGMPTLAEHLRQYVPPALCAEALDQYAQHASHA